MKDRLGESEKDRETVKGLSAVSSNETALYYSPILPLFSIFKHYFLSNYALLYPISNFLYSIFFSSEQAFLPIWRYNICRKFHDISLGGHFSKILQNLFYDGILIIGTQL